VWTPPQTAGEKLALGTNRISMVRRLQGQVCADHPAQEANTQKTRAG
jgi:hypothetical protein